MTQSLSYFIGALAIIAASCSGSRNWGRIRAATAFGNNVIIFNDRGQAVDTLSNHTFELSTFGIRNDFVITAAACHASFLGLFCMFFGNEEIYFRNRATTYENRDSLDDRDSVPDFLWHGIDAVVSSSTSGTGMFFFKGCEYIRLEHANWHVTPRNVSDLNVPCDVDAGWSNGTDPVVLKDGRVWRVGGDINRPVSFDDYLREMYASGN